MSILGLKRGDVKLVPYNPQWKILFEKEKKKLIKVFGNIPIEHIGSTAIPGIKSKPILDIIVGVDSLKSISQYEEKLNSYRYLNKGFCIREDHVLFVKGSDFSQEIYLKITKKESSFWKENILFKLRLLANPTLLKEYRDLKESLAQSVGEGNRKEYTLRKSQFIQDVLNGGK